MFNRLLSVSLCLILLLVLQGCLTMGKTRTLNHALSSSKNKFLTFKDKKQDSHVSLIKVNLIN